MKNKQAFTLIELLVVVLIIGILAAVALPQYRLAVDKTRLMKLVAMTKSVVEAEEAYYLANGEYTTDWDELAVKLPGTVNSFIITSSDGWRIELYKAIAGTGNANGLIARDAKVSNVYFYAFYAHNPVTGFKGIGCHAPVDNEKANRLCKSFANKQTRDYTTGCNGGTCNVYRLK